MKKLVSILLVLLVLVGFATWYFVTYRMDAIIENRIESAGSTSLGTRVSVGTVTTSIRDGSLNISNVTIANPPGYKNKNAFSLNEIEAAVDYANFDIKRVVIDDPKIVIEEMGGETNFSRMLAELEKMESAPANGEEEPIIVVRHFRMNESRAAFESASLDRYSDLEVDAVELNNIKGTPTEVAKIIAHEILEEIAREAATEMLKAQARKTYNQAEEKVTEKLKDMLGGDDDDSGN